MDYLEILSNEFGINKKEINRCLEELKHMGLLITDTIYPNIKKVVNYRLYGKAPLNQKENNNIVTLGPFPIKKNTYDNICNIISNMEEGDQHNIAKSMLLITSKYEYDHFGTSGENEGLAISEKCINTFANYINYLYDINNPIYTNGDMYWIIPKIELKNQIFSRLEIPLEQNNLENWWNIRINLSENNDEDIRLYYKNDNIMIPSQLENEWNDFLTSEIKLCIMQLYGIGTQNEKIINIKIKEINNILTEYVNTIYDNICDNPDKAILLQKLYKKNSLDIPMTLEETLEFVIKIGFLIEVEASNIYRVADLEEIKMPEEVFKIENEWKKELQMYKDNNSIIYNFISPKEYIELTSK